MRNLSASYLIILYGNINIDTLKEDWLQLASLLKTETISHVFENPEFLRE